MSLAGFAALMGFMRQSRGAPGTKQTVRHVEDKTYLVLKCYTPDCIEEFMSLFEDGWEKARENAKESGWVTKEEPYKNFRTRSETLYLFDYCPTHVEWFND